MLNVYSYAYLRISVYVCVLYYLLTSTHEHYHARRLGQTGRLTRPRPGPTAGGAGGPGGAAGVGGSTRGSIGGVTWSSGSTLDSSPVQPPLLTSTTTATPTTTVTPTSADATRGKPSIFLERDSTSNLFVLDETKPDAAQEEMAEKEEKAEKKEQEEKEEKKDQKKPEAKEEKEEGAPS